MRQIKVAVSLAKRFRYLFLVPNHHLLLALVFAHFSTHRPWKASASKLGPCKPPSVPREISDPELTGT